jgi:hypothetical protein
VQTLIVRVRNVYGTPAVYPVNETAHAFARIAGTKTLTHLALAEAEKLGYQIVAEPEPVPQSIAKWAKA